MTDITLTIGGQSAAGAAPTIPVIDPATGQAFAHSPAATVAQLDQAVAAAAKAFATWQHTSHDERRAALTRVAAAIEAHAPELAELVVREQGKPLALAHMEVGGAVAWTQAAAALDLEVQVIEERAGKRIELHRRPIGVVGSITPWNWPLMIAVWHIMPALRAGNTVVIKPSPFTPLSTLRLVQIMNTVLPAGVVNSVVGEAEVGQAMADHPGIGKLVFTGSTRTGQDIMRRAAGNLKRLTLELGGNDAGIVLPGTDTASIAEGLFATAFLNMGQTCAALKRLYVHESQVDTVVEQLAAIAERQVLGGGMEAGVTFGPVQNAAQLQRVVDLVDDARAQGAHIVCGGERLDRPGYFYAPTIV
ncbi:MAG: aldehyde dehydrogenase family protein, partial [Giesbergeria sp.]